jgi:hypothetical protein
VGVFLNYSVVELGELASSVSRLMTACLGAKRGGRKLEFDDHDRLLLDSAIDLVGDVQAGLNFLAAQEMRSPGADKITVFNCVVQAVLNKRLGADNKELQTVKDLQTYFGAIESALKTTSLSGLTSVAGRQLELVQRFFFELGNTLPFEQTEDGTRLTISMEEVLLRELKRVAQEEGIPVHKLVSEIILDHLSSAKTAAKTAAKAG